MDININRDYVTVVYKIVNKQDWSKTNPLHYEHNGLKAVGVSRGDLMQPDTCKWIYVEDYIDSPCYDTGCGNEFILNNGTPKENGFKYCPFCGIKIAEDENNGHKLI